MSGRKGLFYTIDAFVAFGILSIGVVLFLSGFSFEGASSDPQIRVDYVRDFFSSTLLGNVNSDYVIELRGNGSVVSDVSIFQQLVIFHHLDGRNNLPSSEVFFENVVEDNVFDFNDGYNYAILVDSEEVFSTVDEGFESSDFVFVSRGVVVGKTFNPVGIAGPSLVEVFLWL